MSQKMVFVRLRVDTAKWLEFDNISGVKIRDNGSLALYDDDEQYLAGFAPGVWHSVYRGRKPEET